MRSKVFRSNVEQINDFLKDNNNIDRIERIDSDLIVVYWYEPELTKCRVREAKEE